MNQHCFYQTCGRKQIEEIMPHWFWCWCLHWWLSLPVRCQHWEWRRHVYIVLLPYYFVKLCEQTDILLFNTSYSRVTLCLFLLIPKGHLFKIVIIVNMMVFPDNVWRIWGLCTFNTLDKIGYYSGGVNSQ